MRVVIIAVGSRGDVQPFVALARGLQAAGFEPVVATHDDFAAFVEGHGVPFASIGGDAQAMVQHGPGLDWIETGLRPIAFARGFRGLLGPYVEQGIADAQRIAAGAAAIVTGGPGLFIGHSVAEKLGQPFIQAYLQPIHPTWTFPSPLFPTRRRHGPLFNIASHLVAGPLFWHLMRPLLNRTRAQVLGLPRYPFNGPFIGLLRQRAPVLYGFSPAVLPKPRHWGDFIHVTGYWFLDAPEWTMPPDLAAFVAAGPPPVYLGFGSMGDRDPGATTRLVLDAVARAGVRAVLSSGWAGLAAGDLPPTVHRIDGAPHDRLFGHMAAVAHHGGAGTTAAGLRAGKPSVVVPFFADQPFWAERVRRLGVGPTPLPRADLTADALAAALRQAVDDPAMRARADALGARIRAEDGVAAAVAVVTQRLRRPADASGR